MITWKNAVRRALMIVIAPMYSSPPKKLSSRLPTAWMIELVPCAIKVDMPMLTIRRTISGRSPMFRLRSGIAARPPRRKEVHHTALTA